MGAYGSHQPFLASAYLESASKRFTYHLQQTKAIQFTTNAMISIYTSPTDCDTKKSNMHLVLLLLLYQKYLWEKTTHFSSSEPSDSIFHIFWCKSPGVFMEAYGSHQLAHNVHLCINILYRDLVIRFDRSQKEHSLLFYDSLLKLVFS